MAIYLIISANKNIKYGILEEDWMCLNYVNQNGIWMLSAKEERLKQITSNTAACCQILLNLNFSNNRKPNWLLHQNIQGFYQYRMNGYGLFFFEIPFSFNLQSSIYRHHWFKKNQFHKAT